MLAGLLWLTTATLGAQSEEPDSQTPVELRPISVEAEKAPVSTDDVTTRISVIDEARIERELAQNIDDLVRYEPGVDVVNQTSRFGRSGFSVRGIGGNRVQIEVDGVATSDAFSIGSFSNASRDFVDVDSLKQVEIIRGPASAMFGSDALGGVVSFVTKSPGDYLIDREWYLAASGGYNDIDSSLFGSATVAGRAGDWAWMIRANARDGEERDVDSADPQDFDSLNMLAKLAYGLPGAGGFEVTAERFDFDSETNVDSREGVSDYSAVFGFPYLVDVSAINANDERQRSRYSIGQEWMAGKFGTDYLRWRAYLQDSTTTQDTGEERNTLIFGQPSPVARQRRFWFDQELVGLEINAASDFQTGNVSHQLSYGVEHESTDTAQLRTGTQTDLLTGSSSSQVGPDAFPVRDFPKSDTQRFGIYLQDRIEMGALTLVPGVRWDSYTLSPKSDPIFAEDNPGISPVKLSEDELSPKLGAVWQVTDQFQLFGQYAEGFRAPPVNDVNVGFTNFQFGYTTIPNPDLDPESSEGYELGLRIRKTSASLELSGFHTSYDDFIEPFQVVGFDPVNQLLIFQSINIDEVEISGIEAEGYLIPEYFPDGMSLRFAAAWAEGDNKAADQPLNSVAPFNATLGLEYASPGGSWGGSLIARGAARQSDLDETGGELLSPPGYVVYDLLGYWRPTQNIRLRAGIYNLTDHQHTAYLDVQGIPADTSNPDRFERPGRHFSVAVDWSF